MKKIVAALLLVMMDGLGMVLFRNFPDLFFPAYRNLSKGWMKLLSSLSGFLPVTLWDIILLCLAVVLIITLVKAIRKKTFLKWISSVLLCAAILLTAAVYGWFLNHYAPSLSTYIGLDVNEYALSDLYDATEYYLLEAAGQAVRQARDEEGHYIKDDLDELGILAGSSYQELAAEYDIFEGSNARVKRFSLAGDYLLYNGIVGMFMPLTGEAAVPGNAPSVPMPFNMCHEAAHRLGIASEQEANFCAFLACIENEDERFVYSGCYMAFSYCFSSLYRADSEKALALIEKHRDDEGVRLVFLDRSDTAAVYQKYESKLQDVSDKINDTYLKTFSQEDGIRSYGMVSDYLIAWYLKGR